MPHNMIIKIVVAFLVILATVAYWEIGIRVIGKTAFPLLRTDREVGSIMVKNYDGYAWDALSARKNYIRTNSLGYVGDEVSPHNPDGGTSTIRIAMLGDSGLVALQVDYYRNFTALLENALNTSSVCKDVHFEVMNFGVGSAGTFTEYQTYKKKIAPLHPDYVLVFFSGNDYDDNALKAGFDLEHYGEERKAVGLKEFLLQFALPKFLFHKLIANETFIDALELVGILEGDRTSVLNTADTETAAVTPGDTTNYTQTFVILKKFNERVAADGAHFGVVVFPSEATDYEVKGAWRENLLITKLIEFLAEEKIAVFNPADELADARAAYGVCLNFDCSGHFNEEGHRTMAKILLRYTEDELLKDNVQCVRR
jgi:lysophospholipase L1-like esterase